MSDPTEIPGRPTVVLVHGAFADGSSWNGVIERLQAKGVPVAEDGSHVIMISQPDAVTDVIMNALAAVEAPASVA